jgi:hypothetical protein
MARSARSKGLKDKNYLDWIRSQACIICLVEPPTAGAFAEYVLKYSIRTEYATSRPQRAFPVEVAHVGIRGLSQKSSDRETIPLCTRHHRTGKDAHHVLGRKFWEHHGLDRDALIAELNTRYESEKTA